MPCFVVIAGALFVVVFFVMMVLVMLAIWVMVDGMFMTFVVTTMFGMRVALFFIVKL